MMLMAGINLPERALREQIASALNVIVHLARLSDGSRRLVEFSEVTGMEGSVITTQLIFRFEQKTIEQGKVVGEFVATGVRPQLLTRLEIYGQKIPATYFIPVPLNKKKAV
jgi:pilus assembly protein CpaF